MTSRNSIGKIVYRFFIDKIECWTTGLADIVLVNSRYTESVFRTTFSTFKFKSVKILYPCLNTEYFDKLKKSITMNEEEICSMISLNNTKKGVKINKNSTNLFSNYKYVFLSLNRFEVKKNIELAIKSFGLLFS